MAPGQQASAVDMAVEGAEDVEDEGLEAATSTEAAGVADTAMTTRTTDAIADGSTASVIFATRVDTCGAIATNSLMDGLLLKAKRVEEQEEGEEETVEAVAVAEVVLQRSFEEPAAVGKVTLHSLDYWVIDSGATYSMTPRADLLTELEPSPVKHVTSALGQRAEVKGMGKAMFKGADGKMVGLKNVLWVPNLAANLISVRRLQKAGCDESLFMTEGEEEKVFLLVYVDDILLFSPSLERIKEVQGKLKETFQCKALGPVGYFLGLHVERDKHLDEEEGEVVEYELQRRFQSM
ncbi:unnamed protein product, partial [Closterium sp. NIES-54]